MGLTRRAVRVTFVAGLVDVALKAMSARFNAIGADGGRAYPEIAGITGEGWA